MPDFYDYLKPGEFLFHCGRLSGLSKSLLKKKIPTLLERVGLNPEEKRPLRKFSKGMLQRTGIAQTMLADPDLYILDEPMGGLDPIGRRWVKDLILELRSRGKTVFFSSHILAEAESVCDRVAFLQNGRLLAQGQLSDILKKHEGNFEILIEGNLAAADDDFKDQATVQLAGPNTMMSVEGTKDPAPLLSQIIEKGYHVLSYSRQHASLEEVFIRELGTDTTSVPEKE